LGLAIAKGLVEAHGGKIFVTDGANQMGAKFIFTIAIGDE
jgi:signal transduction histidine kinase